MMKVGVGDGGWRVVVAGGGWLVAGRVVARASSLAYRCFRNGQAQQELC